MSYLHGFMVFPTFFSLSLNFVITGWWSEPPSAPGLVLDDCIVFWASLVAQRLERLPAIRETQVWSLGREDPLEKEMTTHSSILAWRILWMEEPDGLQSTGLQRVGHCKECSQPDFRVDHLVMCVCRVISCVFGKGCLLWLMCSSGKTVSFCPASFCTPRPNIPVTLGISTFCSYIPISYDD